MDNKIEQKTLRNLLFKGEKVTIKSPSSLIERTEIILDKKVIDLNNSDLRLLINQKIGLPVILPLVIDRLKENLFIECDYYEGDLLLNTLSIEDSLWEKYKFQKEALAQLLNDNFNKIHNTFLDDEIKDELIEKYNIFLLYQ